MPSLRKQYLEHTNVQQLNLTEMHSTFDKIKNSSLVTITQTHPFSVHDIVCWYLFINKFTIFCISITLILSIVRSILNLLTKVFFAAWLTYCRYWTISLLQHLTKCLIVWSHGHYRAERLASQNLFRISQALSTWCHFWRDLIVSGTRDTL